MADIVAHTIFIPFAHRFPDFLRQCEASLWSLSATCLSSMLRVATGEASISKYPLVQTTPSGVAVFYRGVFSRLMMALNCPSHHLSDSEVLPRTGAHAHPAPDRAPWNQAASSNALSPSPMLLARTGVKCSTRTMRRGATVHGTTGHCVPDVR